MAKDARTRQVVAENRKARFNFEIGDTLEAGIALTGTEVKSLRQSKANIAESYVSPEGNEVWLVNAYIPEYLQANRFNHETRRPRKLLLHKREIDRLIGKTAERGLTLVPTRVYFKGPRAKVEIALGKGKEQKDKRRSIKEREVKREIDRALSDRGR